MDFRRPACASHCKHLRRQGSCLSTELWPCRLTVLAGSGFACDALLIMFIDVVKEVQEQVPSVEVGLVFDDLSLQCVGPNNGTVADDIPRAGDVVLGLFSAGES